MDVKVSDLFDITCYIYTVDIYVYICIYIYVYIYVYIYMYLLEGKWYPLIKAISYLGSRHTRRKIHFLNWSSVIVQCRH